MSVAEGFTATAVTVERTGAAGEAHEVRRNTKSKKIDVLYLKFEIMEYILT
jgi:hypothetical protein